MSRLLRNIEFFFNCGDVYYRNADGKILKLQEKDREIIEEIISMIQNFYPEAYDALCDEYKCCSGNQWWYEFRKASRFLKCNFGILDDVDDFDRDGNPKMENIVCPLRGECRYDGVICHPRFNHHLSDAEMRVMALIFDGETEDEIANTLYLSPHTVHNHIRNAYRRIGVHSRSEFVKFAMSNNLF